MLEKLFYHNKTKIFKVINSPGIGICGFKTKQNKKTPGRDGAGDGASYCRGQLALSSPGGFWESLQNKPKLAQMWGEKWGLSSPRSLHITA